MLLLLRQAAYQDTRLAYLSEPAMSEDISVIVEAAVQRIKREISGEKKNRLESDDIQRHLGDSELDFEVTEFWFEVYLKCIFSLLFFI